jgi:hypothetical protein
VEIIDKRALVNDAEFIETNEQKDKVKRPARRGTTD